MSSRRIEIFCPKCKWEPRPDDRWQCTCTHVWNTFETAGNCPACSTTWDQTQCLSCHQYSPHNDWYHEFLPDEVKEKQKVIEKVG